MVRALVFVSLGAVLRIILSIWLGPKAIAWYFEPPLEIGVNCRPAVEWSLNRLLWVQLLGLLGGAGLGAAVYLIRARTRTPV